MDIIMLSMVLQNFNTFVFKSMIYVFTHYISCMMTVIRNESQETLSTFQTTLF